MPSAIVLTAESWVSACDVAATRELGNPFHLLGFIVGGESHDVERILMREAGSQEVSLSRWTLVVVHAPGVEAKATTTPSISMCCR